MSKHEIKKEGDVTWNIWKHSNGNVYSRTPFVNGKSHGLETGYYPNGNVRWKTPFINDEAHGLEIWFYENGSLGRLSKRIKNELKLKIDFQNEIVRNPKAVKLSLRKNKVYVKS